MGGAGEEAVVYAMWYPTTLLGPLCPVGSALVPGGRSSWVVWRSVIALGLPLGSPVADSSRRSEDGERAFASRAHHSVGRPGCLLLWVGMS